jgi:hypothetical protein
MKAIVVTSLIGAAVLAVAIQPTMAQSPYSYLYCLQFIDRGGVCVSNPFRHGTGYRNEALTRRLHHRDG